MEIPLEFKLQSSWRYKSLSFKNVFLDIYNSSKKAFMQLLVDLASGVPDLDPIRQKNYQKVYGSAFCRTETYYFSSSSWND